MKNALTPRASFLKDPANVSNHNRILDDPKVQKSIDVAVSEYTRAVVALGSGQDLSGAGAQQAAASSFHLISGAYQFLEVFGRLAEPYPTAKGPAAVSESLTKP
jgi:hypothetical protein